MLFTRKECDDYYGGKGLYFIVGHSRCNPFPFSFSLSVSFSSSLSFPLSLGSLTNLLRVRAANFPVRPSQKGSPEESSFSNSFGVLWRVTSYWPGYLSIIKTIHTYRLSRAGSIVFSALSINVLIDFGPSVGERDPPSWSARSARFLSLARSLTHRHTFSFPFSFSRSLRAILEFSIIGIPWEMECGNVRISCERILHLRCFLHAVMARYSQ